MLNTFQRFVLIASLFPAFSAAATDVSDYDSFYAAYKSYEAPENNLTITGTLSADTTIGRPGSSVTNIDGSSFGFLGNSMNGFILLSDQTLSLTNGGSFSVLDKTASINTAYTGFVQSPSGGVFQNGGGALSISSSAFTNNTASRRGGVFSLTNNATLSVSDSAFQGNKASFGNGGVLSSDFGTTASFSNVFFENNTAYRYGGAIFNDGTVSIDTASFISNTGSSGSALYSATTATLKNVYFENNSSSTDIGAIYNSGTLEIDNTTFISNSGFDGGAIGNIGMLGDDMYALVKNASFTNNSAIFYGGAIYNNDVLYLVDSILTQNTAGGDGGAIFNSGVLTILAENSDVLFSGNTANGTPNAISTNGVLNLNASPDQAVIFNDPITGSGNIFINRPYVINGENVPTGGTISLNADMSGYTGSVVIADGLTQVQDNGTFFNASSLTVENGTLDIGSTKATVGNAVFDANSVLALTIQDSASYGYLTADSISITPGAKLKVTLSNTVLGSNSSLSFHLLQSTQSFIDAFSPNIDNNLYTFTQLGDGWYEVKQSQTYRDVIEKSGGTQNNQNTATAWQTDPSPTQSGTAHAIYEELDMLVQNNGDEYVQALTALAPSAAPLLQVLGLSYLDHFQKMTDRSNRQEYRSGQGILWADTFGSGSRLDATTAYPELHIYGYGIGFGAEYIKNDWTVGAAYLYQFNRLKDHLRSIQTPTHGFGFYTSYTPNNFIWNTKLSFFYSRLKENKDVGGYQVINRPSAYTTGIRSDIGYVFTPSQWMVTPKIGLQYAFIRRRTSTDSATQKILANNLHFLTGFTKLSIERSWKPTSDTTIIPSFEVGASYDLSSDKDNSRVILNNALTYTLSGQKLSPWQADLSLGLTARFGSQFECRLGAEAAFRHRYQNYIGSIKGIYYF